MLGLAGVMLAMPSAASGRSHLAASFHLRGSHGYGISVIAHRAGLPLGTKRANHRVGKVTVRVARFSESGSSAEGVSTSYTAPARFNRHRIRARLGHYGKVRLRFDKNARFLFPPRRAAQNRRVAVCMQHSSFVTGEYRGVFRFHGEDGYTSAHAHRVRGRLERVSPLRCRGHNRGVELKARSASARFLAFQDNDYGVTVLFASKRERAGPVEISRQASRLVLTDAGEFIFDAGLTGAHVAPGGTLFTGSADYASPGSWTGGLAVSFAGREDVPLTGPGFDATLRSGKLPARAPSLP